MFASTKILVREAMQQRESCNCETANRSSAMLGSSRDCTSHVKIFMSRKILLKFWFLNQLFLLRRILGGLACLSTIQYFIIHRRRIQHYHDDYQHVFVSLSSIREKPFLLVKRNEKLNEPRAHAWFGAIAKDDEEGAMLLGGWLWS